MTLEEKLHAMIESAPPHIQRHFAADCAERALRRAKVKDKRLWKAVEVSRRYAEGRAELSELAAAWDAAWDAAVDASAAARAAARDASAASAASAAADAWDAAWDAVWDEEREWQLTHLHALLAAHDTTRSSLLSVLQQRAESIQKALPRNKEALEGALFT